MSKFEDAFKKAGVADSARLRVLADTLLRKSDKNIFTAEDAFLEAVNKDCGLLKALIGVQLRGIAREYLKSCVADMAGKKGGSQIGGDTQSARAPAPDIASHDARDTQREAAHDQTESRKGHVDVDTQIIHAPWPDARKRKPQTVRTPAQKAGALYVAKHGLELLFAEIKLHHTVRVRELDVLAKDAVGMAAEKFKGSHTDAKRAFFARRAKEKCGVVLDDNQKLTDVLNEKTIVDISRQAHEEAANFLKQASSLLAFAVFDGNARPPEQLPQ